MPPKSKSQRKAAAIAKNHPEKLHKRNRGMTKMTRKQLNKYASGSEKGLPKKKKR